MSNLLDKIIKLELSLSLKETRSDINIVNKLLHKDFYEYGTSGFIFNRDYTIEKLVESGHKDEIVSFDFDGRLLDSNIYQLIYKTKRIINNEDIYSLRSSLWKNENNWQMIFHQASKYIK